MWWPVLPSCLFSLHGASLACRLPFSVASFRRFSGMSLGDRGFLPPWPTRRFGRKSERAGAARTNGQLSNDPAARLIGYTPRLSVTALATHRSASGAEQEPSRHSYLRR